jgi:hypothetical protein
MAVPEVAPIAPVGVVRIDLRHQKSLAGTFFDSHGHAAL